MEDLRTAIRTAEEQALSLLKQREQPLAVILRAFSTYRHACADLLLAAPDLANYEEQQLWSATSEARKFFHATLRDLRKSEAAVQTREFAKLYLDFLKSNMRFYRTYIYRLGSIPSGIPELESIAQKVVTKDDSVGESPMSSASPAQALISCHRSLIYLGDLYRYRATEGLDTKKPLDFGPAVGYYGLAASLIPDSGLGHHQLAVVALEKRSHLQAIYHLYRSLVVEDPHPHAHKNLVAQMARVSSLWDKGELIKKGPPNDPDAGKHALVGWFIRLQSMCFHSNSYRGYHELEREILARFTNLLKERSLGETSMRIVLVSIIAQYRAGISFRDSEGAASEQQKLLHLCRFNLMNFAALLQLFYDDLRAKIIELDDPEAELNTKVTPLIHRILPYLRVYTNWLLPNMTVRMICLLANDPIVSDAVQLFWPIYARVIDLIAQAFPIWDLDDLPWCAYMLEEDVETLGIKALWDEESLRTSKTWYEKDSVVFKPRFSASSITRCNEAEEDLRRIKDLLADGLFLANDEDLAPIKLRQTRIYYGDISNIEPLTVKPIVYTPPQPIAPPPQQKPKVISYATAAANGHAMQVKPKLAAKTTAQQPQTQEAQLNRMVDNLVDDEIEIDARQTAKNHVAHPPISTPAVPSSTSPKLRDSAHESMPGPARTHSNERRVDGLNILLTPPANQQPRTSVIAGTPTDIQRLWNNNPAPRDSTSPRTAANTKPLGSPALFVPRTHSRNNSSIAKPNIDPAQIRILHSPANQDRHEITRNHRHSRHISGGKHSPQRPAPTSPGLESPLLFGAGESVWSPGPALSPKAQLAREGSGAERDVEMGG